MMGEAQSLTSRDAERYDGISDAKGAKCSYCAEIATVRCDYVGKLTFGQEPPRCRRPLCGRCAALEHWPELDAVSVACREHAKATT